MSQAFGTWIRRHYVGLLALFVALGGTAYAAAIAPKNSVVSKSIKKGAVKSSDLRNDRVKGVDVDEATLDFSGLEELTGPPGPTFATLSSDSNPVPPANPDTDIVDQYAHTFVTPESGRLLAFASLRRLGVNCSAGPAHGFLYLDGVGIPGSGAFVLSTADAESFVPIALTETVPAGEHELRISYDCPGGNPVSDSSSGDGELGAILIGD